MWLKFKLGDNLCELEVRLFPKGANVIARAHGKSVALRKPLPLKEVDATEYNPGTVRPEPKKAVTTVDPRQGQLAKLKKACAKVEAELEAKKNELWQGAGEQIKITQTLEVSPELAPYIDREKSLAWNIQNCFQKAKAVKKKQLGTEIRLAQLRREMTELENQIAATPAEALVSQAQLANPASKKPDSQLLHQASARGRTFDLGSDTFLYVGKSADDNLRLLRKAKAWHLWLHLRDHPGSHGIIARNKNQRVDDATLQRAAHHLLQTQFGAKAQRVAGDKFSVIVTECRFVRPIRGDRLGRVNYSDERTFLHLFNPS